MGKYDLKSTDGYAGKPSDVGNLVAFLASDEAAYITSEVINCGGGMIV